MRPSFTPPNRDDLPEQAMAEFPFPEVNEPDLPPLDLPPQASDMADPPSVDLPDFVFDNVFDAI